LRKAENFARWGGANRQEKPMSEADPVAGLLEAAAKGDRRAFSPLYVATSAKLYGVLLRILRDREEADDALQEVYARVWSSAGRYDPAKGRGMTWLITIARNRAIDRLRARPPLADGAAGTEVVEAQASESGDAEAILMRKSDLGRLGTCLDVQPADRAAALRGAYVMGLSYAELAARHAVPINTMRTWLRRGLQQLRECMEA